MLAGLGQRAATLGLIYAAERNVLLALQIYQQTAGRQVAVSVLSVCKRVHFPKRLS